MRALGFALLLFTSAGCAKRVETAVEITFAPPPLDMPAAGAELLRFAGRGIHYFEGAVECPMAGVGSREARDSNRISLDDGKTTVTADAGSQAGPERLSSLKPRSCASR